LASFGHAGHQIGSKGNIYVAETDSSRRIQRFKPVSNK